MLLCLMSISESKKNLFLVFAFSLALMKILYQKNQAWHNRRLFFLGIEVIFCCGIMYCQFEKDCHRFYLLQTVTMQN